MNKFARCRNRCNVSSSSKRTRCRNGHLPSKCEPCCTCPGCTDPTPTTGTTPTGGDEVCVTESCTASCTATATAKCEVTAQAECSTECEASKPIKTRKVPRSTLTTATSSCYASASSDAVIVIMSCPHCHDCGSCVAKATAKCCASASSTCTAECTVGLSV